MKFGNWLKILAFRTELHHEGTALGAETDICANSTGVFAS